MEPIIDLDVTSIANDIYELQARVEAEPKADDVSRGDWTAVAQAVRDLYALVLEKCQPGAAV